MAVGISKLGRGCAVWDMSTYYYMIVIYKHTRNILHSGLMLLLLVVETDLSIERGYSFNL